VLSSETQDKNSGAGQARTRRGVGKVSDSTELLREVPEQTIPLRHWGRWASGVLLIVVAIGIIRVLAGADIDYAAIPGFFVSATMLQGLVNTILLGVSAMLMAAVLGTLLAMLRLSANPVGRGFAAFYIWLFRGPPVLLQIFLWFNLALIIKEVTFGIPFTDITFATIPTNDIINPFTAALLGLGLNEAAFMAEIVRGGILGVNRGQTEAAHSLGMSPGLTFRRVIFPQTMRIIIPPTGNTFINTLKATSLAAPITYLELIHAGQNVSSINLLVMEALIAAALWYMVIVTLGTIGQHFLEQKFDPEASRRHGSGSLSSKVLRNLRNPLPRRRKAGNL